MTSRRPPPMAQVLHAARHAITGQRLITAGAPVIVAVSGGADSSCLLDVLDRLRPTLGVTLHVVHLDHGLRGAAAAADALAVADEARRRGLAYTIARTDVARLGRQWRANTYAIGRAARHALFTAVARHIDAQAIALGHQADDLAETVLLHLLRGGGSAGLAGMAQRIDADAWPPALELHDALAYVAGVIPPPPATASRAALIRPLLAVDRADIAAYCREAGLVPREDPDNGDRRHRRAWVRHELLPVMQVANPQLVHTLAQTAAIHAGEQDYLQQQVDQVWPALAQTAPGRITLDGTALAGQHPALQRLILRRAWAAFGRPHTLDFAAVERARALLGRSVGARTQWPAGTGIAVDYHGMLVIGTPAESDAPLLADDAPHPIAAGQCLALGAAWCLCATPHCASAPRDRWSIAVDTRLLDGPPIARPRRPGDRLQPVGAPGHRRVQDIFVDQRVPRRDRDRWPIIADARGPLWIPGIAVDHRLTAHHAPQLILTIHRRAIGPTPSEAHHSTARC